MADHGCEFEFNKFCGARVCVECEDHKGLERCYCGWSRANAGSGYRELAEMGEQIEAED